VAQPPSAVMKELEVQIEDCIIPNPP